MMKAPSGLTDACMLLDASYKAIKLLTTTLSVNIANFEDLECDVYVILALLL